MCYQVEWIILLFSSIVGENCDDVCLRQIGSIVISYLVILYGVVRFRWRIVKSLEGKWKKDRQTEMEMADLLISISCQEYHGGEG